MNWCGESHAGYPVLRGFSLHRRSNAGVYCRESSTRSLIYAHPDFAGGETIRALHYAILDLQAYVDDPLLRQKHYDSQVASCRKLVEQNGCPTHVIRVDTEWVRARLIELDTVIKC